MKKNIVLCFVLLMWYGTYAQVSKDQAISRLKQIVQLYTGTAYLSFDVHYKYASAENPGQYLDSLNGSLKMNGSNIWYALDSTECISNKNLTVMLFKQDQLMYLSKPSTESTLNPIAALEESLTNENFTCTITKEGQTEKITIEFGGDEKNKRAEYYIDSKTGFISKMLCLVKAEQLYDPSVQALLDSKDKYAIVEIRLDHYRQRTFDDRQFDTGKYFVKQGDEFVAVTPYESYKIFVGTPNL